MKQMVSKVMLGAAALSLMLAPAVWAENIKIGAILAVTGPMSFLGGPEARTLQMLVEETNAKGGRQSRHGAKDDTKYNAADDIQQCNRIKDDLKSGDQ